MCSYLNVNKCSINDSQCPYVYFCNKKKSWVPLSSMPENCKVKENISIPKGCYKVRMERKGYLYVDIKGQTYKILNPFSDVPLYVKATKLKNGGWRLKKYEG